VLICHERRIPLASLPATVPFREGSIAACMPGGYFLFFIIENIPYRDDMARGQAKNLFRHVKKKKKIYLYSFLCLITHSRDRMQREQPGYILALCHPHPTPCPALRPRLLAI
jgi:hypothetical protein